MKTIAKARTLGKWHPKQYLFGAWRLKNEKKKLKCIVIIFMMKNLVFRNVTIDFKCDVLSW